MFKRELQELRRSGLLRDVIARQSTQGPLITFGGRQHINFSSNDYLGLAEDPRLAAAGAKAAQRFGAGSGSSRLLLGGCPLHERLERKVSRFKKTESALLFNSGYAANTGAIASLAGEGDVIFSDELNHASIIDGTRLSKARLLVYRHRDVSHLNELIRREGKRRKLVVTDSVFSMDGDIAPLGEISGICRQNGAMLYIDDAHGTGVLGGGRGALAHFGIAPEPWIIQMGTFSKALGSFGAFIAGSKAVTDWLLNTARSFMFSTALPPFVVGASLAALGLLAGDRYLVRRLWNNRERLATGLRDIGCNIGNSETPVIPLFVDGKGDTRRLSSFLLRKRIYAPLIRPPSVKEPRLRITITAAHEKGHIDSLIEAVAGFGKG